MLEGDGPDGASRAALVFDIDDSSARSAPSWRRTCAPPAPTPTSGTSPGSARSPPISRRVSVESEPADAWFVACTHEHAHDDRCPTPVRPASSHLRAAMRTASATPAVPPRTGSLSSVRRRGSSCPTHESREISEPPPGVEVMSIQRLIESAMNCWACAIIPATPSAPSLATGCPGCGWARMRRRRLLDHDDDFFFERRVGGDGARGVLGDLLGRASDGPATAGGCHGGSSGRSGGAAFPTQLREISCISRRESCQLVDLD